MSKPNKNMVETKKYEKDKKVILKSFKEGLPMRRMIERFGYTKTYVTNMRNTLIKEGILTEGEIKSASAQYYKEHPSAQGLNKTKVRKSTKTGKAEIKHKQFLENRETIFKLVKQKYTKLQISNLLKMNKYTVDWHINELIEERKTPKR